MTIETVLPDATIVDAVADGQQQHADQSAEVTKPEGQDGEEAGTKDDQPKKEKTHEEREIARLRRRVDNLTRQKYELQSRPLRETENQGDNRPQQADSDTLSLSRAELNQLVEQQARRLAPTISKQDAEIEHRNVSLKGLVKELGTERFQELTDDLASVFDGSKQLAILETDNPRALLEYLTDPDNADEAKRIAGMSDFHAGRALVGIETKIKAAADKAKPVPSKAGAPLEPLRSEASAPNGMPNPANTSAYIAWANKRDAAARTKP